MSCFQMLPDVQWSMIEGLLPRSTGWKVPPFADAWLMVEGSFIRIGAGSIAGRDLPEVFGPWQTVWTWHRRRAVEGLRDTALAAATSAAASRQAGGLVGHPPPESMCPATSSAGSPRQTFKNTADVRSSAASNEAVRRKH